MDGMLVPNLFTPLIKGKSLQFIEFRISYVAVWPLSTVIPQGPPIFIRSLSSGFWVSYMQCFSLEGSGKDKAHHISLSIYISIRAVHFGDGCSGIIHGSHS